MLVQQESEVSCRLVGRSDGQEYVPWLGVSVSAQYRRKHEHSRHAVKFSNEFAIHGLIVNPLAVNVLGT
jgi:hypothetical protein